MGGVMLSFFLTCNQILLLVCECLQMRVIAVVTGYIPCPYKVLEWSGIL